MTSTGKIQRTVLKSTIPSEKFQPTNIIVSNGKYRFLRLTLDNKQYLNQAFELFNYCWEPLTIDMKTFIQQVENGIVIVCVGDNSVKGMVTLLRTHLDEKQLGKLSYKQLTGNLILSTNQKYGDKVVCIAICSRNYKTQISMKVESIPNVKEMMDYLNSGLEQVYNFHLKSKGGLDGAKLVAILPNSRPEDEMSLGYNLLLEYPKLPERLIIPNSEASVAVQLIEAVMNLSQKLGISRIFAFSRPVGASQYFSMKQRTSVL